MKILILGDQARYEKYMPALPFIRQQELVFLDKSSSLSTVLAAAPDAEILFVDAITAVPAEWIHGLPRLKMIHSEGVAYDKIDLDAAREGRQMEVKERYMESGIRELSACRVGLVGFGDIAKATAERLAPFGCEMVYYSKHRRDRQEEEQYGVTYLSLEELTASSDIVSLHCAVNDETRGMVNEAFLNRMRRDAYLVNTARGDLVDNEALRQALLTGHLAGVGLDTLAPEPVPADHPLVTLPAPACDRVVLSPHLGGITEASFRRAHLHMWRNAERVVDGHKPDDIVNGVL